MAQVITTILVDDNPKGMRLIEMGNWSGKAFIVPRAKLKEFREVEDSDHPGIYFLFGDGEDQPTVYIGQSGNVVGRLTSHDAQREKEEWNEAFVFVRTLDSTLIRYLESKAVHFANLSKRYKVFNGNTPGRIDLSEAQKITGAEFFEKMKLTLHLFGYPIFTDPDVRREDTTVYEFKTGNVHATGKLLETQEFVVFKGSTANIKEAKSFAGSGPRLRQLLNELKVFQAIDEDRYVFTRDYICTSPSAAANAIAGRECNGWVVWKDQGGKTLDENVRQ